MCIYIYIYIYIYTLLLERLNLGERDRERVCECVYTPKKRKHVAESCKFTKYFIKFVSDYTLLYCIINRISNLSVYSTNGVRYVNVVSLPRRGRNTYIRTADKEFRTLFYPGKVKLLLCTPLRRGRVEV